MFTVVHLLLAIVPNLFSLFLFHLLFTFVHYCSLLFHFLFAYCSLLAHYCSRFVHPLFTRFASLFTCCSLLFTCFSPFVHHCSHVLVFSGSIRVGRWDTLQLEPAHCPNCDLPRYHGFFLYAESTIVGLISITSRVRSCFRVLPPSLSRLLTRGKKRQVSA